MSVRSISLRKLIKILFAPANRRVAAIRKDIREDMNRSHDAAAGGGDFYAPFWRDAKNHVSGLSDLHASVKSARDAYRYIYRYLASKAELTKEAARLSLWLLRQALPNVPIAELRVLDVDDVKCRQPKTRVHIVDFNG